MSSQPAAGQRYPWNSRIQSVLTYILLVGAGLLGNLLTVELFFNVDLIFGSIAALIIVYLFGLLPGTIAAAVIALPTCGLWNQPYAVLVFTLEVAFVGLLLRRRGDNVLMIDTLYWLTLGFLANLLVYGVLLRLSPANMWVVVLKQGVNGVVNALIAGVVIAVLPSASDIAMQGRQRASVSIRDAILYTITGFVVVPSLLVFALQSRVALQVTEQEVQDRLVSIGNAVELMVDHRVEGISRALGAVARSWSEHPHSQESLAQVVRFGSDALSDVTGLRIADSSHRIQAMYPGVDDSNGRALSAHDLDAVTASFDATGLGISSLVYAYHDIPSLSVAVPWGGDSPREGAVFGTLRLDNIRRQLEGIVEPWGLDAAIVGPGDLVIVSTNRDAEANDPLGYMRYGTMTDIGESMFVHVPDYARDVAAVQRWHSSSYLLVRNLSEAAGWTLVLSAPLAPYQTSLNELSIQSLTLVFALIFGTIVLSRVFGTAMVKSLGLLSRTTSGLPARILESEHPVSWPRTGIREVQVLINNFRDASEHIAASVNELRSINEDLVTARFHADSANQAKSRFLANMSHDLRTPLNGILGYAQLLVRDEDLAPEYRDAVRVIETSGNRLLGLLNDVLDLSRIEADRIELHDTAVDVDSLLSELTAMVRVQAQQKGLRLEQVLDPDLPQLIVIDEKKLQQILTNLVSNAVKFTPSGMVRVAAQKSADGQRIAFSVTDTGVGIPEHELEEVFSPFIQGEKPRIDGEGTGLGLAIVKRLVDFLGGTVSVRSTVGSGTTFYVTFPLRAFPGAHEEQTEPQSGKSIGDERGLSFDHVTGYIGDAKHILVVDHLEANRRLLTDLLVPLGFTVDEATDSGDLAACAQDRRPDLIIIDVVMPGGDGFEAYLSLQENDLLKDIPVIASSGSVSSQLRYECRRVGFSGFFDHPLDKGSVLRLIAETLGIVYVYDTEHDLSEPDRSGPDPVPRPDEVSDIARALRRGDIREVIGACEALAASKPMYAPYCATLTSLARGFKLKEIDERLPEESDES